MGFSADDLDFLWWHQKMAAPKIGHGTCSCGKWLQIVKVQSNFYSTAFLKGHDLHGMPGFHRSGTLNDQTDAFSQPTRRLYGGIVPLQLGILRAARGEILQAQGVHHGHRGCLEAVYRTPLLSKPPVAHFVFGVRIRISFKKKTGGSRKNFGFRK